MTQPMLPLMVLLVSLCVLVYAARLAVDSLIDIARMYEIPDALIAMSVVAIGTSLPEIGSHVTASIGILSGQLDLHVISHTVIGGNMGSSTVQQLLFVGILFIGIRRREYKKRFFVDTYLPMLGTFVLLFGLAYDGVLSHMDGLVLLIIFIGYMIVSFQYREKTVDLGSKSTGNLVSKVAIALGGLTLVVASAYFTLTSVEKIIAQMGLNGSMVGVISIGFAAALPEFSTVIESIRRGSPYLALGTLIGSNVVNPLLGIGAGAAISTYTVPPSLLIWDLPFKFVAGILLLVWIYFFRDKHAGLREGFLLVGCYFLYFSVRMIFFV